MLPEWHKQPLARSAPGSSGSERNNGKRPTTLDFGTSETLTFPQSTDMLGTALHQRSSRVERTVDGIWPLAAIRNKVRVRSGSILPTEPGVQPATEHPSPGSRRGWMACVQPTEQAICGGHMPVPLRQCAEEAAFFLPHSSPDTWQRSWMARRIHPVRPSRKHLRWQDRRHRHHLRATPDLPPPGKGHTPGTLTKRSCTELLRGRYDQTLAQRLWPAWAGRTL
jgi:hypothetical protein